MRILFMAGRELSYTRNDVLIRALRRLGSVEVVGSNRSGPVAFRSLQVLIQSLPRLFLRHYDLTFVGFYGHLLMVPVSALVRGPIVFDAFLSTYDTLCFDRRRFAPESLLGRLAFWLDQFTARRATRVLLDTDLHSHYFHQMFNLPSDKFAVLPVGCNEELFFSRPEPANTQTINVLFYTTYLPLHGAEIVIRAAAILSQEARLRFTLLGDGPQLVQIRQLADDLNTNNVQFLPPTSVQELPNAIARAHICLGGHFGTSGKAARVIPGKVYQILAMARPLVAADSQANRELLTHGKTAFLCPPGDAAALAEAIWELHQDAGLRHSLGAQGRQLYEDRCSEAIITQSLATILDTLKAPMRQ